MSTTPTPLTTSPTLVVRDVHHRIGSGGDERLLLRGASLDVDTGEWLAVRGRSGCGKSTLLHLFGGLERPTSGSIRVAGTEISALRTEARARFRRRHVGYVFQQYNLLDDLTVAANVELPLLLAGRSRRRARSAAGELLEQLGLDGRGNDWPASLSGGEQQRVAIARAVAVQPELLLADEPTGALDPGAAATVVALLRTMSSRGRTIVMVTHDPDVAAAADRIVHLHNGVFEAKVPRPVPAPEVSPLLVRGPR